jgi:hypothetical protein
MIFWKLLELAGARVLGESLELESPWNKLA